MTYAVYLILLVACFSVSMTKALATPLIQPRDEIISISNKTIEIPQNKAELVSVGSCHPAANSFVLITEWRQDVAHFQLAWVSHPFWGKIEKRHSESLSEETKIIEEHQTFQNLETCQQNKLALSKAL